jgi:hypothetical protein
MRPKGAQGWEWKAHKRKRNVFVHAYDVFNIPSLFSLSSSQNIFLGYSRFCCISPQVALVAKDTYRLNTLRCSARSLGSLSYLVSVIAFI